MVKFWRSKSAPSASTAKSSSAENVKASREVSAVPTTKEYALDATSEAIRVLQSAVDLVGGVPGAKQVLELALGVIETCKAVSEIEEKVDELKSHIERIMLVMVQGITKNSVQAIPKDLIEDIKKLGIDLQTIKQDLDQIAAQNRMLIAVFKTANRSKINRCMELLKQSLVHWEVSRDINQGVILNQISQGIARTENGIADMSKSLRILNQQVRKDYKLSHEIPLPPSILYGRDAFVEDIVNLLTSTTLEGSKPPRICIHAPGGMGKTSAALAVMGHTKILDKFGKEGRIWVPCIQATSPDLFLQLLYDNFRISLDTGDPLADIVQELSASPTPRLILLDNFETIWYSTEGGRESVENMLNQLSALARLSILMTMRSNTPPTEQITWIEKPLDVVDPETSYDIYCAIHPAARGKPQLKELLAELGHMPFATTVVAQLGKTSKSMPAELLESWREGGLGMLHSDGEKEDNISRSIGLSMNSKTMADNVPARTLLATLALLPAGTTHSRLNLWTPQLGTKRRAAISSLNNVALILDIEQSSEPGNDADSDVSITVLPVVRSYMEQGDRIPAAVRETVRKACCQFILEHQSSPGEPGFKDNLRILSTEEVNLQSVLLEVIRRDDFTGLSTAEMEQVLKSLVALGWYQHWTKPRTDVVEQTLSLARKFGHDEYIAESLFCLGSTLFRLDKYNEACEKYTEARVYFRKLSNSLRVCKCSFELSTIYQFLFQYPQSKEALDDISEEELGPAGGYLRACEKMARGEYLYCCKMKSEALECLKAAKEVFEEQDIPRPVELARCYHYIGRVLGAQLQFKECLEAMDQSVEICDDFGLENELVDSLVVKGYLLLAAEAPVNEALPTLERSLEKTRLVGNPIGIAQALELLGELYAREKQVISAINFYQAAEDGYKMISQRGPRDVTRCRDNLKKLAIIQSDPNSSVEIQRFSTILRG